MYKRQVYTPRPDGGNGVVTGYKVEVSKDGTSFEKVAEGKLADNAEVKTISFLSLIHIYS